MKQPVIIVGIGEIGGVFARGMLRSGHPVYPVTRTVPMAEVATAVPHPATVLLAVAENHLHQMLENLPTVWRNRCTLLQNELLPADWRRHGYQSPTTISIWFEKKPGQDVKTIIPSPAFGAHAELVKTALESIGIPVRILSNEAQLLFELVRKNLYILTTNIAGIKIGGNVGELWTQHRLLAEQIAGEVIELQSCLTGKTLDRATLMNAMVEAFEGDREHKCMGRSAPARLQRALQLADQFNVAAPVLRSIAAATAS